ncbi:hypothetical protein AVEN_82423-1, partial [Araneus ventricosus]
MAHRHLLSLSGKNPRRSCVLYRVVVFYSSRQLDTLTSLAMAAPSTDNPYHCDCSILWFRDWLQARGQNVANLPRETRCNSTKELAQKPIVKLSNSSFVCSSSSNPTVVHPFLLVLLFTTLVFCMC